MAGFVEAPRFYPCLSGRRNLELAAALDGGPAAGRIDAVELAGRAARPGGRLLARHAPAPGDRRGALLRTPRLLVLDEPATGLDPAGMSDVRALVRRLADDHITVLLSSHQMSEVEELCNRVAIVRRGRVVHEGVLTELLEATGASYDLRTTDDPTAARIARADADVGVSAGKDGLRLDAAEDAVTRLTLALGAAGVGVHALVPRTASLEELFLEMTHDDRRAP